MTENFQLPHMQAIYRLLAAERLGAFCQVLEAEADGVNYFNLEAPVILTVYDVGIALGLHHEAILEALTTDARLALTTLLANRRVHFLA